VPPGGDREFINAMWDKIMLSQGHSSRVLKNWEKKDMLELKECLMEAATELGVEL